MALDFLTISVRTAKRGTTEIYPKFRIRNPSQDLMIRGGDFYAVWVEELGKWSTNEQDVIDMVDKMLDEFAAEYRQKHGEETIRVLYLWDAESGMIDAWHKYCQKQMRDNFHMLDEKLIFSNDPTNKKDYSSKRLDYPLEPGETPAWDKIIGTLYSEEERHKIEWAIGSIVSGDSKTLQKFVVLYGAAGTGKSTILNIIQQLFEGYYSVFDAKALGSANSPFALEAFKTNPLVAIQHDGDLSRIEDNTRLNSLVSHELMTINEKFKSAYANRFKAFLFMGTNKPVKITDGKSGLLRRLIDVHPSGNKLSTKDYRTATKQVKFELGAIAYKCREIYLDDPNYYDDYIPIEMMGASNDFYNFVIDNYHVFVKENGTTLKAAWEMYKTYCEEAKVPYISSKMKFKEELKNYFWDYSDRFVSEDGSRISSYYSGFRTDIFEDEKEKPKNSQGEKSWIHLDSQKSIFDEECADCPAQYASQKETPNKAWDDVTTTLADLDTSKIHYVRVPENHIVIDFDIKNEKGEKDLDLNLAAASSWPATYAELSKGGSGLHLHYIFTGDVSKLSAVYDDDIEIKKFTGKSSLRRKLTKCNDISIATISSGLPLKEDAKKMINKDVVQSEKGLRTTIKKCLNKEIHPNTKPNVDFINDILTKAYDSGMHYDVSDLKNSVLAFAAQSTNQSDYCIKLVNKIPFKSEEPSNSSTDDNAEFVFFDVEVFPNLFLVNWKIAGEGNPVVRMINPKPHEIEELLKYNLIGFNNRSYDNHMLYARLLGYSEEQLYDLSQKIINEKKGQKSVKFGEAYNLSYTDIYDFAAKKQSLKKWEIELGIHHQELGIPWDQPVPEDQWIKVAEYCDNDVLATEAVFNHLKGDFTARQILAELAGMTPNDTTNSLTTRIIFGNEKNPALVYTDLATGERSDHTFVTDCIQAFPGYEFKDGKNMYRGTDLGFGGYVYAEPGMYGNVALLDIASLHPHSIIAMNCFGDYTRHFHDILDARIYIKHKEFDKARTMLGGKLAPYLDDESTAKDLAQALKIAINSVYGLTAANFPNPFRDIRNKNNIVALRGALFMRTLQDEVTKRGFKVAHIKTDSIKIPDATPEIIDFCMKFANDYGYTFEHEATYERMCLVNDAVYIAKYKDGDHPGEWTATGTQFQVPYVFKKLFSKEPIEFEDMCETKSVTSALYLSSAEKTVDVEQPKPEDLTFIGKVGLFCPIKPECGGKELLREGKDKEGNVKYSSATGAKGYKWLEAEMVKALGKENDIDRSYYDKLVNDAIESISQFGDFEWFVSDDPYISKPTCDYEKMVGDLPWYTACGKETCFGCPNFNNDEFHIDCSLGYDVSDMAQLLQDDGTPFEVR